jgi:hypothetical protein
VRTRENAFQGWIYVRSFGGTIVAQIVIESTRRSAGSWSFTGPETQVEIYENTYRRRWFTMQ